MPATNRFYINTVDNVDIKNPKRFLLISPEDSPLGKEIHLTFSIDSNNGSIVEIFENTVVSNDGNPIIPINSNRKSNDKATLKIFEDPKITDDGMKILARGRMNLKVSGRISISRDNEIILKQNTKYQLKITPFTNDSMLENIIDWHEV